ncbi:MAG: type 1 glutamine amidotransferase [Cypionkella sp.]|nr:type 1 glutamine amidotransferase [Cypionkella sp.]
MKIGILQTGEAPDALRDASGDYPDMFMQLLAGQGFDFAVYSVLHGVFPSSVTACDGWLVTGSRHGAYEDHPWIPPLEDFIRAAYDAQVPTVGICFGHQIIAQAMGGRVEGYADGWSAVGPPNKDFEGQRVTLNAWHQDQVVVKPAGRPNRNKHQWSRRQHLRWDKTNAPRLVNDRIFTVLIREFGRFPAFMAGLIEKAGQRSGSRRGFVSAAQRAGRDFDKPSLMAAQTSCLSSRPNMACAKRAA